MLYYYSWTKKQRQKNVQLYGQGPKGLDNSNTLTQKETTIYRHQFI